MYLTWRGGFKQTLQEVHAVTLDTWPRQHVAILTTTYGEPFTSKGSANWCADRIADAGLPDRCVTHRLRKAAARRLAEAGCTALQIAKHHGPQGGRALHQSRQPEGLASDAISKLGARMANKDSQTE